MAISLSRTVLGPPARPQGVELQQKSAIPKNVGEAPTELDRNGGAGAQAPQDPREVVARAPTTAPQGLDRAVEEANETAETALAATNRSISFEKKEGLVAITIRDEIEGEEVVKEIPPEFVQKIRAKLRALQAGETSSGVLIDTKA